MIFRTTSKSCGWTLRLSALLLAATKHKMISMIGRDFYSFCWWTCGGTASGVGFAGRLGVSVAVVRQQMLVVLVGSRAVLQQL